MIEINMDIQNINVPEIIRSSRYDRFAPAIKNYEDTLQKLLLNNKESSMTNNPFVFLWKVDNDMFPDFTDNIAPIVTELFGIEEFKTISENIIITGPFVRSCLINSLISSVENKNVTIIKELYFYRSCAEQWDQIIDVSSFEDKKTEYVFELNDKKIFLIKKKYKHSAHVILQHDYLKRVGYCNGNYYVSSMFLIEIQKHLQLLGSKFSDPILNIPYDPLEIYKSKDKDKNHPTKIIEMSDFDELTKLNKKYLHKQYNNKTCLELCIDKYMAEEHSVILNQLLQMIVYVSSLGNIRRPIILYASLSELDKKNIELFNYLKRLDNIYKIEITNEDINYFSNLKEEKISPIDLVNNFVLEKIIKAQKCDYFEDFLLYAKIKINKSLIDLVIKHDSEKIAEKIVSEKELDKHLIYYLIIMSENFELTKSIDFELDINIAINYLKEVLSNGKIRSFYFMYELDQTILNTLFDDNKNILHVVKQNGNFNNLIDLITNLKPDLLNLKDTNKETPIMFHSKFNPEIVKNMLEKEFDYTITDSDGNTFLHHLCKKDYPDVLKLALKRCPELINMPNKKSETPIIISAKNNNENMFYVLQSMGADLEMKDLFGNTVFHYICCNSMCLGMAINDNPNYFGLKPSDYSTVSNKYYTFIVNK